jgi:CBS domain-containing protein
MIVREIMKHNVVSARLEMTVLEAAKLMIQKKVGTLPITDEENVLIGILTVNDILDVFIPDYFELIKNMQFVHDFGALEDFLPKDMPEVAGVTLQTLMEAPISIRETDSILRAATKIFRRELIDLPVVNDENKLVGLVSHVDVGTKFLQKWIEGRGYRSND